MPVHTSTSERVAIVASASVEAFEAAMYEAFATQRPLRIFLDPEIETFELMVKTSRLAREDGLVPRWELRLPSAVDLFLTELTVPTPAPASVPSQRAVGSGSAPAPVPHVGAGASIDIVWCDCTEVRHVWEPGVACPPFPIVQLQVFQ